MSDAGAQNEEKKQREELAVLKRTNKELEKEPQRKDKALAVELTEEAVEVGGPAAGSAKQPGKPGRK